MKTYFAILLVFSLAFALPRPQDEEEGGGDDPKPEGEDGEPKPDGEGGDPKPDGEGGDAEKPDGEKGDGEKKEGEEGEEKKEGDGKKDEEKKPDGEEDGENKDKDGEGDDDKDKDGKADDDKTVKVNVTLGPDDTETPMNIVTDRLGEPLRISERRNFTLADGSVVELFSELWRTYYTVPATIPGCGCITRGPLSRLKLIGNIHYKKIKVTPPTPPVATDSTQSTVCPPCPTCPTCGPRY